MKAGSGLGAQADWRAALDDALDDALAELGAAPPTLALVFAAAEWEPSFGAMLGVIKQRTGASVIAGCSGQAIIGRGREIEGRPAVAVLLLSAPSDAIIPVRVTPDDVARLELPADAHRLTGARPEDVNGWLLFVDPFTTDALTLVNRLTDAYPGAPLIGGLASGGDPERGTRVFLDETVFADGAVLVGVAGPIAITTVVAQGAQPIGEPWTVTRAERNILFEIGGRPAVSVLAETLDGLTAADRERARRNLLIGLALDEYRATYRRGDFLIRNVIGIDPRSQAIAINELTRVGQTVQFQLRDAVAADADLRAHLAEAAGRIAGDPIAIVLCSCNGRGRDLFGAPDHDAAAVAELLAPAPLAGFFCNGEIGPVGSRNFLHGFTASLAVLTRRASNGSDA